MAIAWVHPAQSTADSVAWRENVRHGAVVVVPALWSVELANTLLVLQRRKRITLRERTQMAAALRHIPVDVDHDGSARALEHVMTLAEREGLSAYGAVYLDLAMRRKLPLGCKDGQLRTAAIRRHVSVEP